MTTQIVFVADPPQLSRLLGRAEVQSTTYIINDRITSGLSTYRCTVGGVSAASSFTAPTWGTTTWVEIQPDSWGNAATETTYVADTQTAYNPAGSNRIYYVDAFSAQGAYAVVSENSAVVYVHPGTMEPMQAHPTWYVGGYGVLSIWTDGPVFFGIKAKNGYYCRDQSLVFPYGPCYDFTITGSSDSDSSSRIENLVDSGPVTGNGSDLRGCPDAWGLKVKLVPPSGTNYTFPPMGVACEATTTSGSNKYIPAGRYCTITAESAGAFAPVGGVSANSNIPLTPTSDWQVSAIYTTTVTNSYYSLAYGTYCTISKEDYIYRNGVFPAGDAPYSYQLGVASTIPDLGPGRCVITPYFTVLTTLTGSRTLSAYFACSGVGALTNTDVWIEVSYGGTASSSQYSFATTMHANGGLPEARGAALTELASATWTEIIYGYDFRYWRIDLPLTITTAIPIMVRFVVPSRRLLRYKTFFCPIIEVA